MTKVLWLDSTLTHNYNENCSLSVVHEIKPRTRGSQNRQFFTSAKRLYFAVRTMILFLGLILACEPALY